MLYSEATDDAAQPSPKRTAFRSCETQAGKSSPAARPSAQHGLGRRHRHVGRQLLAEEADVVLAVGTRLQDFTTGSWALFKNDGKTIIGLNVQPFDAGKHRALPLVADARVGLEALDAALGGWKAPAAWTDNGARRQGRLAEGRRQRDRRRPMPRCPRMRR